GNPDPVLLLRRVRGRVGAGDGDAKEPRIQRALADRDVLFRRGHLHPAGRLLHRRHPDPGVRGRHHGALPLRDHAPEPGERLRGGLPQRSLAGRRGGDGAGDVRRAHQRLRARLQPAAGAGGRARRAGERAGHERHGGAHRDAAVPGLHDPAAGHGHPTADRVRGGGGPRQAQGV
ncbi:MAG: NADH-ubiquinone oxidoreductase chain J, partial [uncultured Gemmatimonadetes bacterium]